MALKSKIIQHEKLRSSKSKKCSFQKVKNAVFKKEKLQSMTVIKITVIHSTDYDQITMGIETLRNIVIITTDIFAVQWKIVYSFHSLF